MPRRLFSIVYETVLLAATLLNPNLGVRRFLLAVAGVALFGIGFAWALVDRDRQFLHDRLAGTIMVSSDP